MKKLLLADDHALVRDTIAQFLRLQGGVEVRTADCFHEAAALCRTGNRFDLVLLDYTMPGMEALSGLRRMLGLAGCPVAILSGTAPPEVAPHALDAGAAGFLPKTLDAQSLVAAVHHMLCGQIYQPPHVSERAACRDCAVDLTPRETDVLRGLSEGKSNKEIARDLDIREVTVKLHLKTLSRKLGARNRTHAAILARNIGLA